MAKASVFSFSGARVILVGQIDNRHDEEMKTARRFCLAVMLLALFTDAQGSDWLKSPKPKFPQSALKNYSEGTVRIRAIVANDGVVREARVIKSGGDAALDNAAQEAVLKWKMKPAAIKPIDLTKGREEIIEFRQEAALAARHPDRLAAFTDEKGVIKPTANSKLWMFAPFPSYPIAAHHEHGTVKIRLTIGKAGTPEDLQISQSSGYSLLDQCALRAVRLWRAHKQYAGRKVTIPITFASSRF